MHLALTNAQRETTSNKNLPMYIGLRLIHSLYVVILNSLSGPGPRLHFKHSWVGTRKIHTAKTPVLFFWLLLNQGCLSHLADMLSLIKGQSLSGLMIALTLYHSLEPS